MNSLERSNRINTSKLDQEQYFQSLLIEAHEKKLISPERMEGIQLELIELLGKEVDRYTNGESSSVPVTIAQQILKSITFCIGLYLKSFFEAEDEIDLLRKEKMTTLFYRGMDAVNDKRAKAEQLLKYIQNNLPMINNYAYQDTLGAGIAEFFQHYEMEFGAYEIPADIDYPLYLPLTNLLGVEYIYEYLRRITLEQELLQHFSVERVNKLLSGFHRESEHMLINVFELVLTNALGCKMLDLNVLELNIPGNELSWFYTHYDQYSGEQLSKSLEESYDDIARELTLQADTAVYTKAMLPQLADRIRHNLDTKTLPEIFISLEDKEEEEEVFFEGMMMEDEKLRELIDELREYSMVSKKLDRVREVVSGYEDWIVIFEECFYENEYEEVLRLLTEKERTILIQMVRNEAGPEGNEDYVPDKEWKRILFRI